MLNGLYSKQVYWPDTVKAVIEHTFSYQYFIELTIHAGEKINQLGLPNGVYKAMAYGEIIEAEFYNGKLIKVVTRLPHRTKPIDICAAILVNPDNRLGKLAIKTIWTNRHDDNHITINKEAYVNG